MRFAYIDSQGNEVPIPSVEALGLRIELGAIGPDTELYDAQSDRWGPAHTHEIFHTLSRDAADEGGFVAPPPPVHPVPPREPPASPPSPPAAPVEDDLSRLAEELGLLPDAPARPVAEPAASSGPEGELDFGLTLTDEGPGPVPPTAAAPPRAGAGGKGQGRPDTGADEEVPGALDFGTLTPLDLDEVADLPTFDPAAGSLHGAVDPMAFGDRTLGDENLLDLADAGDHDPLDIGVPGQGLVGDAPPAWIEQTGPDWGGGEDEEVGTMRFGPGGADLGSDLEDFAAPAAPAPKSRPAPAQPRPEPRPRPAPPRRAPRRSYAGIVLWVFVLGLIGGGGYYGWKAFGSDLPRGRGEGAAPELPTVTIPEIPASLEPRFRELGEAALDATIASFRALPKELKLEDEPRTDWLSGGYLANASQFPDIEAYWTGIEGLVDRVRDTDTRVFHDQFAAGLSKAGIEGDTARILLARADSGFLATRRDRFEAYAEMDDLVNAALDLHQFLLRNEGDIEYTPAAGGYSRDPVLEAVPATKALGDEMWGMVDRITEALDALGSLDKVTTDKLAAVLLDRMREAGFR